VSIDEVISDEEPEPDDKQKYLFYMGHQIARGRNHQQYLTEQYGRPVDLEEAMVDWTTSDKAIEFRADFNRDPNRYYKLCKEHCNYQCKGIMNCDISPQKEHDLEYLK